MAEQDIYEIRVELNLEPAARLNAVRCGPWLMLTIPVEKLGELVTQGLVKHELDHIDLPGVLVVDARRGWHMDTVNGIVSIFQSALILSGQDTMNHGQTGVACAALVDEVGTEEPSLAYQWKYATSTERTIISTVWKQLVLLGEPFVQPTVRGYAPALLVSDPAGYVSHLLVGAKSLFDGLEAVRKRIGRLDGVVVEIRKKGHDRVDLYEVRHVTSGE